jgi:hypothetical protein
MRAGQRPPERAVGALTATLLAASAPYTALGSETTTRSNTWSQFFRRRYRSIITSPRIRRRPIQPVNRGSSQRFEHAVGPLPRRSLRTANPNGLNPIRLDRSEVATCDQDMTILPSDRPSTLDCWTNSRSSPEPDGPAAPIMAWARIS